MTWCVEHRWATLETNYEHAPSEMVMFRTHVKTHFNLHDSELGTLPSMALPSATGKTLVTYAEQDVWNLVYRRAAVMSGAAPSDLKNGRIAFENNAREQKRLKGRLEANKAPRSLSVAYTKEIAQRVYSKSKDTAHFYAEPAQIDGGDNATLTIVDTNGSQDANDPNASHITGVPLLDALELEALIVQLTVDYTTLFENV